MKGFLKIISIFLALLFSQYIIAQDKVIVQDKVIAQDKIKIDFTCDTNRILKKGDTVYNKLIGNVYFYHNGAIISCDTAYYYSQTNRFVGIQNVIINQDSLYVYGDKVTYTDDGLARVYAPLVKVVDSSTVMYTRNLIYNTTNSIARYFGGATVEHKDNKLESINGFYDSKRRVVLLRDSVVVENIDYKVKTDSLDFYLDTEAVFYECRTYIWKANGDFLQSDIGSYSKLEEVFHCEENSYVLTIDQELWADTISYYSLIDELILKNNIQMLDTVKMLYAFGDYGQYWKKEENVLLTKIPSIINYSKENTDTLFLSSDTLFIRPFLERGKIDSLISDSIKMKMDSLSNAIAIDKDAVGAFGGEIIDGEIPIDGRKTGLKVESLQVDTSLVDSLIKDSLIVDSLVVDSIKLDSLSIDSVVNIDDMTRQEYRKYKKKLREKKKLARKEKFLQWLRDGGMNVIVDTVNLDSAKVQLDSLIDVNVEDSLVDNKIVDVKNIADSSDYIIRGYSTSKIFRNDVQMVCDTLISETVDSTTTFIGSPIMWNENNQITAKRIRTYTKNENLYRSRLYDEPIVAQRVELGVYNQIKGNYMDAMFRDNSIYRLYVNEASETIFYNQDETVDKYVEGLTFITSVNMIVDMDSTEITNIDWYTDIESVIYPIDRVPETQTVILYGFEWRPQYKPTKKDVFDRSIRPSYRKEAMKIEKPELNITIEIENLKKSLIRRKVWRDRVDLIPNEKKKFRGI